MRCSETDPRSDSAAVIGRWPSPDSLCVILGWVYGGGGRVKGHMISCSEKRDGVLLSASVTSDPCDGNQLQERKCRWTRKTDEMTLDYEHGSKARLTEATQTRQFNHKVNICRSTSGAKWLHRKSLSRPWRQHEQTEKVMKKWNEDRKNTHRQVSPTVRGHDGFSYVFNMFSSWKNHVSLNFIWSQKNRPVSTEDPRAF